MSLSSTKKKQIQLLAPLSIYPGASRSQDRVELFDPESYALPIPCGFSNYASLGALVKASSKFVGCEKMDLQYYEIAPLGEKDPLVQSTLTNYVAFGDGAVYKMVQMNDDLFYMRKLPVPVSPKALQKLMVIFVPDHADSSPLDGTADATCSASSSLGYLAAQLNDEQVIHVQMRGG